MGGNKGRVYLKKWDFAKRILMVISCQRGLNGPFWATPFWFSSLQLFPYASIEYIHTFPVAGGTKLRVKDSCAVA